LETPGSMRTIGSPLWKCWWVTVFLIARSFREYPARSGKVGQIFVVSLAWTRPMRNGTQVSHASHSRWAISCKRSSHGPPTPKTSGRNKMTLSSKDQIQGTLHEAKGTVKEQVGKATNNPTLVDKGQSEKVAGKVQKKLGQIEKVLDK
jgi:uncharacterized protein YjbJ (UPF0337 family)